MSAAVSLTFDDCDACSQYQEDAEQAADLALTIRARRFMLACALREIDRLRVLAHEVADLLASILGELDTHSEVAEVIMRALAMAEDRR